MHIHIIGICGTFMGGLAALAQAAGHRVTGCDAHIYPPMSEQLATQKIDVISGFEANQLDLKPDLFVIGNVAKRGMPIIEAILNQNLSYTSGPQWLSEYVLSNQWVLAVAGTHGKTTTASMLAWILEYAGFAPGFLIGGVAQNFSQSARLPQRLSGEQHASPFFIIEADEYDTAFFDKRSKFVHYRPRTVILNNLEFDHADIFADLAAIETQFHHLVRTVPEQGLVIHNSLSSSLQRVLDQGCWTPTLSFGQSHTWHAYPHCQGFDVFAQDQKMGTVNWTLMGSHNELNAIAALLAARHIGISLQVGCEALSSFQHVKRRQEIRAIINNMTVYDDFAHHPTAIKATLTGLRRHVGTQRILAVLELRSNTMKMGAINASLPDSLACADYVFCYSQDVAWDVKAVLAPLKDKATTFSQFDQLVQAVLTFAQPYDHILIMSNGSFNGIHEKLLVQLTQRYG